MNDMPRAWQRMLSGRRLDLLNPSPLDVEFEDIAHGLARVARWNGQTSGPHAFSVAQHSLLVEHIAAQVSPSISAEVRLYAVLHDAAEYVIGDMISPFKAAVGGDYKAVEARLAAAIHLRAGLAASAPEATRKLIKKADRIAAFLEATALAGFADHEAERLFERPRNVAIEPAHLQPLATPKAQNAFLERVQQLESETSR